MHAYTDLQLSFLQLLVYLIFYFKICVISSIFLSVYTDMITSMYPILCESYNKLLNQENESDSV